MTALSSRRVSRTAVVAAVAATVLVALALVLAFDDGRSSATSLARNGQIAFSGDNGSGAEIYTIHADGSGLRRRTHLNATAGTHGDAGSPDWSRDAGRITFGLEDKAVYVMNADGSGLHRVTPGGEPVFARDGHHIVYWCDSCAGGDGIFLVRDDGADAPGVRLTTNPFHDQGDENPEISPDGRTLTFVRHKVGGELQALFAADIDGTHLRQLTSYAREVAIKHDWAPSGRQIVLTTDADYPRHRSPNVATIRPDGSHLRMLTHYVGGKVGAFAGSYSPNGRWIVFRVENVDRKSFRLFKMHPDGTHRRLIRKLALSPRQSDWGPRQPAS
jgi:Tol biopolymer transport system component